MDIEKLRRDLDEVKILGELQTAGLISVEDKADLFDDLKEKTLEHLPMIKAKETPVTK